MNTEKKTSLSQHDIDAINALIKVCESLDNVKYDFYTGDACCEDYFELVWEKDSLIAFLSCFSSDACEVSALVHPSHRRNGIFKSMLSNIPTNNYILTGHDDWPNIYTVANHVNFTNAYHEYLMEYSHTNALIPVDLKCKYKNDVYTFYKGIKKIGHCQIMSEESQINIFDVFVNDKFRNNGYGKQMINYILSHQSHSGKSIILQVSEKNKPAFNLYLKCGFVIKNSVLFFSMI